MRNNTFLQIYFDLSITLIYHTTKNDVYTWIITLCIYFYYIPWMNNFTTDTIGEINLSYIVTTINTIHVIICTNISSIWTTCDILCHHLEYHSSTTTRTLALLWVLLHCCSYFGKHFDPYIQITHGHYHNITTFKPSNMLYTFETWLKYTLWQCILWTNPSHSNSL